MNEDWLEGEDDEEVPRGSSPHHPQQREDAGEAMGRGLGSLASREQERQLYDEGYREGADESRQQGLQTGFDEGFMIGMKQGKDLGLLFGVISATLAFSASVDLTDEQRSHMERLRSQLGEQILVATPEVESRLLEEIRQALVPAVGGDDVVAELLGHN